jgi:hypothetical protein
LGWSIEREQRARGQFGERTNTRVDFALERGPSQVQLDEMPNQMTGEQRHQLVVAGPNLDIVVVAKRPLQAQMVEAYVECQHEDSFRQRPCQDRGVYFREEGLFFRFLPRIGAEPHLPR